MRGVRHGMGEEMLVIAIGEIGALQRTTGLMTGVGGREHGLGELNQMLRLPDGGDLLIERGRLVVRGERLRTRGEIIIDRCDGLGEGIGVATHRGGAFHRRPEFGHQTVGVVIGAVGRAREQRIKLVLTCIQRGAHGRVLLIVDDVGFAARRGFDDAGGEGPACAGAEQACVKQGIRPESVRAVHGYAGAFAGRIQTFDGMALAVLPTVHFAAGGDGDAAHGVVGGGFDWHEVMRRIDAGVFADGFDDLGECLLHVFGVDARHVEPYAVLGAVRVLRVGDARRRRGRRRFRP